MEFVRLGLFALLITFRSYLFLSLSVPFALCLTPRLVGNFTNRMRMIDSFECCYVRFDSEASACDGICQMELEISMIRKRVVDA